MAGQNKFSFSLRRMLFVPVIFAMLFWLIPQKEAVGCVLFATTCCTLLLFLANRDNLPLIIIAAAGCIPGIWFAMFIVIPFRGPRYEEVEILTIAVGVTLGYLFIKFVTVVLPKWLKYLD
jgi:hypothetical protein